MKKVRLADIAGKVGVSTVTVHNALAGQKGVSDTLREQIQKTANEMGYVSPARKDPGNMEKNQKIGVLIAENYLGSHSTYYWKLYQDLALCATEKQCYTTVEALHVSESTGRLEMPQMITQHTAEGLIIIGEVDKGFIRELKEKTDMPMVFLDFYDWELAQDAVIVDGFYGTYQLTELLLARGFEEIGFIGSVHATSSIMDRYCGYMKAMMEHQKPIRPKWVLEDRDHMGYVGFGLPDTLPEAFVCNCDLVAGMLVSKLNAIGLKVPEDLSVVGFDNFLYPGYADMKITSYEVKTKTLVQVALKKLLKQMRGSPSGRGLEIVSGHIVMKDSIKC